MNQKNILFSTLFFIAMMVFGVVITFESITGRSTITMVTDATQEDDRVSNIGKCSDLPKTPDLQSSEDPHLQKLLEAETICDSFVTDELMIFVDMPKDKFVAEDSAVELSETLKEFDKYDIEPIVIVEPVSDWGLIDFEEFSNGFYSDWLDIFFKTLKKNEVNTEMMGLWVPFPEANLPYWNREDADPTQFSNVINEYVPILKKSYPEARVGILLNSATYSTKDFNWADGEYTSLVPWVEGIKPGLVDTFGIQGFPWHPQSSDDYIPITNAEEFLNPRLAMDAADQLEVRNIWFNTGTYSSKYTLDPDNMIFIDIGERREILDSIIRSVKRVKNQGYTVSINIFSEDKSSTQEATNWSYWIDPEDANDQNRYLFKDMLQDLEREEIDTSLFIRSEIF